MSENNQPATENLAALCEALAKAQGAFVNPERNRTVKVKTNKGDNYSFTYATLDAIMDMVRKPLADNGLSLTHTMRTDSEGWLCVTELRHASGTKIECPVPVIVSENANAQGWGSAMTYARRYGVCTLLAIAADEDDDANSAAGNYAEQTARGKRGQPDKPANGSASQWGGGKKPEPPNPQPPAPKSWGEMTPDEKTAAALGRIAAIRQMADPVAASEALKKVALAVTPDIVGEANYQKLDTEFMAAKQDIEGESGQ